MKMHTLKPSARSESELREEYRKQIARLPLTMQPALNQQVSSWDELFPYEQKRVSKFLHGVSLFAPGELDKLTHPLRELEARMDVSHWNFSRTADTMENASQLARSPYYVEWRKQVQRVFSEIEAKGRDSAPDQTTGGRLILIVLPETLPISSIAGKKPWDGRGIEYKINGDPQSICESALRGPAGLPALIAGPRVDRETAGPDCWLIDADAALGGFLDPGVADRVSLLQYQDLKRFRDEFLAQVNTVPKDIEATDEILAGMRKRDWDAWWPSSLADQRRLRSFMIELFLSGNGALIFSNAFVQWTASEAIRRARPRLVMCRFGIRSKPKPFTSIAIFENQQKISAMKDVADPEGSAIDALILARYIWLSASRYPEQQQTSCICIGEASRSFLLIAPESKRPSWEPGRSVPPEQICEWMRHSLA